MQTLLLYIGIVMLTDNVVYINNESKKKQLEIVFGVNYKKIETAYLAEKSSDHVLVNTKEIKNFKHNMYLTEDDKTLTDYAPRSVSNKKPTTDVVNIVRVTIDTSKNFMKDIEEFYFQFSVQDGESMVCGPFNYNEKMNTICTGKECSVFLNKKLILPLSESNDPYSINKSKFFKFSSITKEDLRNILLFSFAFFFGLFLVCGVIYFVFYHKPKKDDKSAEVTV